MTGWIIAAVIYVIIGIAAFFGIFKKWEGKPLWEKIWYAVFWPATLLAYGMHKLYNWWKKNHQD